MPISSKVALSALLACSLAACGSPPVNARGAVVPQAFYQPAEASDPYAQTSWELARWTRPGGALRPIPRTLDQKPPITLAFTHENGRRQVSGFGGCNAYSSVYTVANGLILLNAPPLTTRRACVDSQLNALENDFLQGLTGVTSSTVDQYGNPQRLTLTFPNGDILDFARRLDPMAGYTGEKRLIYVNAQTVPCTGVAPMQCLEVRDDPGQPWQLFYGNIVGFDFQPGMMYRLRIVESINPNPPAHAPSWRRVLDEGVEPLPVR